MPLVVDRWLINGSQQPIRAEHVRMYGFGFRVDRQPLVQLCDRYLNIAAGSSVRYVPPTAIPPTLDPILPTEPSAKTGVVIVTFAHIGKLTPHAPYDHVGWTSETEATFWVLTTAQDSEQGHNRRTWFVPYIFVDLPIAITLGREIYGYPKEIGWFAQDEKFAWGRQPADGPHTDEFTLDAFGVEQFNDQQFARRRVMTLSRDRDAPDPSALAVAWTTLEDAAAALRSEFFSKEHLHDILDDVADLWPPHITAVLLKQTPDPTASRFASLQSVIEARQQVDLATFAGGGWLHGMYDISLPFLRSHPISQDLGLQTGDKGRGYWLDFDFTLQPGTPIWAVSGEVS